MQGDIQCNYMEEQRVRSDRQPRTPRFLPFAIPLFSPFSTCSLFSFSSTLLSTLPSLGVGEPDEALMESTGSQHLPHLRQTGRSPPLSVPPRACLSFPLRSPLLPPPPTASSAEKALDVPSSAPVSRASRPDVFFCLPLMCAGVQQAPFFCRGTSGTPDLDNSSCQAGG